MTDTPKTDKQSAWHYDEMGKRIEYVAIGFARQLERELTAAREELKTAIGQRDAIEESRVMTSNIYIKTAEQRDRLAEALQKLADCDWVISLPDRMDAVRSIAREALQSLNQSPNNA